MLCCSHMEVFISELLSKEESLSKCQPVFTIHVSCLLIIEDVQKSLSAFLLAFLQVLSHLHSLCCISLFEKSKSSHEEILCVGIDSLLNNLINNLSSFSLVILSLDLLKALLDEASQVDNSAVSWSLDFEVREHNLDAE